MYKLNYYSKLTEGLANKEQDFEYTGTGETFRLRRNALNYLFDIVQNEYRAMGYATEKRVGSLYCYKSWKDTVGNRKVIEILIKVESNKKGARELSFAPNLLFITCRAIIRVFTIRVEPRFTARRWCRFTTSRTSRRTFTNLKLRGKVTNAIRNVLEHT